MRRILLMVGASAALVVGGVGCGDDAQKGPKLVAGSHAPDDGDPGDDGDSADPSGGDDVLTPQPADTGNVAPASTAPSPCSGKDVALCFTFDGSGADQSSSGLRPAVDVDVSFVPGKQGMAAVFKTSSALRFGPSPVFDLPSDGATIEAWIDRTTTGADAVVFDDDERFSLTINAAGQVWCKSSGGAVVGATVVPTGQWVHVACVIDKGAMRAYLNGVEDAAGSGAIVASPSAGAAVGGNSPTGEPFVGTIDSLRVLKIARTAAEIAAEASGTMQP